MDKYERRRQILLLILSERCNGKIAELALKLGRVDNYVGRMLYEVGKAGKKRIGDDMAELIAKTFDVDMAGYESDTKVGTHDPRIAIALKLMQAMDTGQLDVAIKVLDALAQPRSDQADDNHRTG